MSKFEDLFNRAAAKKKAGDIKERQAKSGDLNFWQPKNAVAVFRVLPPGSDQLMSRGLMGKLVYKHFLWWDNKSHGVFNSGPRTDPELYDYCPIQDAIDRVQGVVPQETLDRIKARPRALMNIILRKDADAAGNLKNEELYGKPIIGDLPVSVYNYIQTSLTSDELGFFVHPHEGADVICERTGTGMDTRDPCNLKPGPWGPICATIEETDKMCDSLPDLDKFTRISDDQKNKAIASAKELLAWASPQGTVDTALGSGDANLANLVGGTSAPAAAAPAQPATEAAATAVETALASPQQTVNPGQPVCFGEFVIKNPGATSENPKDPMCKECDYLMPCSFESETA